MSSKDEASASGHIDEATRLRCIELEKFFRICEKQLGQLEKQNKFISKCSKASIEARKKGNVLFLKKGHTASTHKEMLAYYTKSIAFAPLDTEELALAYNNRSILMGHLRHYEESLADLNKALSITKNNSLKSKLRTRRKEILTSANEEKLEKMVQSYIDSNDEMGQELFKMRLNIEKRSAIMPSAADCVSLACDEKYGRHLVANRDIKPGEMLIVEEGYVCYPREPLIHVVCSHCLQIAWTAIPCERCAYTVYCCPSCKDEAFREYHDIECSLVKYIQGLTEKPSDRMTALRLLIKAVKKDGFETVIEEATKRDGKVNIDGLLSNGILQPDKFKSVYNLMSYQKEHKVQDDGFDSVMVYLLTYHTKFFETRRNARTQVIDTLTILTVKDILNNLYHILDVNAFWYQATLDCSCSVLDNCKDSCDSSRGIVIAPTCCMLNHSCIPNVNRIYTPKRQFMVFACTPIKKGEQLCDSYGATFVQTVEARRKILDHFHFNCTCLACTDNVMMTSPPSADPEVWDEIVFEFQQSFPDSLDNSFFVDPLDKSVLSEDVLKVVLKMSELYYKHLDFYTAYGINLKCRVYIERLLLKLFGEEQVIPANCE